MTGEIPRELGGLSNLRYLSLAFNRLTGEIPRELGGLSNLTKLRLYRNQLTGCIPEGLRDITDNDLALLNLPDCGSVTEPEAPRGLTATADGQAEIDLSWSAPSDDGGASITGYRIEVSEDGSNWSDLAADTRSTSGSYTHSGLTAGSARHYRVSAINSAGTGTASNTANATTDTQQDTSACATGGAVPDAANNPGLVSDCEALLAGKDTLVGTGTLNWSADVPMVRWDGVSVGNSPTRVLELNLGDNQLTGEIPPELGGLSYLRHLYLSSNQLTGEIPPELGRLSRLTNLYLSHNQLTGGIPPELGGLSNLIGLVLFANQLTGEIPPELGRLGFLELLVLARNQLTGEIPPELGRLFNLTGLYLANNQLTGCIPEALRDIAENDLVELNLPDCTTATPPGAPTGLTATADGQTRIDLSWTAPSDDGGATITGYKVEVSTNGSSWSNLVANTNSTSASYTHSGLAAGSTRHYRVSAINSAGTGPASNVDNATTDTQQDTSACATGGAVPDAANNPGLVSDCEALLAGKDTLVGTGTLNWSADVPMVRWNGVSVGNSPTRVLRLNLAENQLTGGIPTELGGLSNLTELSLRDNQLTGEIPPELGRLSRLTNLYLSHNQLTGGIPTELGGLSNLTLLDLGYNRLTGEIPTELGGLSNLTLLDLGYNRLTGEIPTELGGLSNLTELWLDGNQLTGEIPTELGGLSNLEVLDLGYNRLTGEIPTELGGLSNLTELWLRSNQFTGEIPTELGGLSNLTVLALESNRLTGEIPPELGGLSNLRWLLLDSNRLTGEIPPELGGLSNLTNLYLRWNQLTGCIPEGLRDIAENDLGQLNLPDCGAATPTPTATLTPDLVVGTPTVDASAPAAGARITLSATVRNRGNGSSGSTTLRYYRSTDSTVTTGDTEVGTDSVGGLSAAGSGDESISLTAPSSPGVYYYGACVEAVSDESDATNNCSPAVVVTVGSENTYGVGDFLPGVPRTGVFIPAATVGASLFGSGGSTTITFNNGGYIELQDGTRYTCQSTDGCRVHNGEVTQGTIVS